MSLYQQNPLYDEALEEVNNILDDEGPSETDALNFKIVQLQKIITTLTRTNERLIQRIEDLEEQIQLKSNQEESINFNQEYSVIQGNLGDAQEMITQYKAELKKYQDHINATIAQRNSEVQRLQEENEDLKKENENLKYKLDEYQDQNEQLLQTKDSLITEIQELQSSLRKSKAESPRYTKHSDYSQYLSRYDSEYTSDFGMNVQAQLEKLIEKLVKELEHERIIKKKLTEQIKQLQRDMLQQQKELIAKNNKIYSLEITALKKNKTYTNGPQDSLKSQPRDYVKAYEERGRREKEVAVQKSKNFSLMELMNECTILSSKEKLVLTLKIIELFTKKMQRNDYSSQILQSILICNYNPSSPHLCMIKVNPHVDKDQDNEQDCQTSLIWNLVFVLDSLLSQTATKDHPFGQADKEDALLEAINYYLQNRQMNSTDSIVEIRKMAEEALSDHIR